MRKFVTVVYRNEIIVVITDVVGSGASTMYRYFFLQAGTAYRKFFYERHGVLVLFANLGKIIYVQEKIILALQSC